MNLGAVRFSTKESVLPKHQMSRDIILKGFKNEIAKALN